MSFCFDRFVFDPEDGTVTDGKRALRLTPKSARLLRFLVERPSRLAAKDEILDAVWADTHVSDGVLKVCVAEIRRILGDDADAPRYVETVHGRGYRFIAEVSQAEAPPPARGPALPGRSSGSVVAAPPIVGREAELDRLGEYLGRALAGRRQLSFVTGEPGIGKSALVDAFLERTGLEDQVSVARGQCVEQYGAGEPYLPFLEALGRLCREEDGLRLIDLLRRYAPKWLAQMPWLVDAEERQRLERDLQGASRERMLREMAEFLEAAAALRPLVLVLEDLHWSDSSTVDLLSVFARRPDRARVLVLGTYRPAELIVAGHPLIALKRDLAPRGQCHELALDPLAEGEIALYLSRRFAGADFSESLARVIHGRTDGHPLFTVSVVDHAVAQGLIAQVEGRWSAAPDFDAIAMTVPDNLRQMIDRQIDALDAGTAEALQASSVAGAEFSTAAVASALGKESVEIEQRFEELMQRGHFIHPAGLSEWPDGTVAGRYAFVHDLYREVAYRRIGDARRVRLHRRIGERIEAAFGERTAEVAAELALHFDRGRDSRRAIRYLRQAGENAVRRFANLEAIDHLRKALELIEALPDGPERAQEELRSLIGLFGPLVTTRGFAAPEVGETYARARELCEQFGEAPQLFPVLMGLRSFYTVRGELGTARELGERVLRLAEIVQEPPLLVQAHYAIGLPLHLLGELGSAREHLERGIALYDGHGSQALIFGQDFGIGCFMVAAQTLWVLGYPEQALRRGEQAIRSARELSHLPTLALGLMYAATVDNFVGDLQRAAERADEATAISREHGFPFFLAAGLIGGGWALTMQGHAEKGIPQLKEGLAAWRATGSRFLVPYYLYALADSYRRADQVEEALAVIADGFAAVEETEERWCEAELHRLKGDLTLKASPVDAEACFQRAIASARRHDAKSWELRAVTSLSRLWREQGKKEEARETLAKIYAWFTEGFDTVDLKAARALLEELSAGGDSRTSRRGGPRRSA